MTTAKAYTFEEITTILMALRGNKMDFPKTAHTYKVGIMQLRQWHAYYANILYDAKPVVITDANAAIKAKRELESEGLRETASEIAEATLKRLLKKINNSTSISVGQLTQIVKEVFPYIMPKLEGKGSKSDPSHSVEFIYEKFIGEVYNKVNNNGEKITIKGTSKK